MTTPSLVVGLSPIGALVRTAWDSTRQHLTPLFWLFLPSTLIGEYVALFMGNSAAPQAGYTTGGWIGFFATLLLMMWASGASLFVLSSSQPLFAGEAVRKLLPRLAGYTFLSIVTALLVMLGFVALVVPGLIVGTLLFFTDYAYLLEGTTFAGAFRRSTALSAGRRWPVFWRIVVLFGLLGVISFALATASGILAVAGGAWVAWLVNVVIFTVSYTYMAAYGYELYRQLAD